MTKMFNEDRLHFVILVMICSISVAACGGVQPTHLNSDGGISDATQEGSDGGVDAGTSSSPQFLSCIGLVNTCGSGGNDSCCNSLEVPAGSYDRSYDLANDGAWPDSSFPAAVSGFRLDKYEVTVGRFRAFVNAEMGTQSNPPLSGAGAHLNIAHSGWDATWSTSLATDRGALSSALKCDTTFQTWTDVPAANEHRPINCVTWYEAMAFCAWDGGYIPTEAEWDYAATGGDEQRAYPWSEPAGSLTIDNSHASYNSGTNLDGMNCVGDGMPGCALTDLTSVGTKPAGDGRWGQSDLAGNVYEWVLDWAGNYTNPCDNCANLTVTGYRMFRGGSYGNSIGLLRASFRNSFPPSVRSSRIGIRCGRIP